jgi:nucleoside-diphosphate-sugar epimerase
LQNWYSVAKISSEEAALEYAKQTGLDVMTVNPAVVFGPLLQPTLNTSCQFLVYFLKGFLSRITKQNALNSYLLFIIPLAADCVIALT